MTRQLGLKTVLPLIAIAGLSMGNKGCETPATGRLLKMDVEIGSLKGRAVKLPNGEVIDFPYVANALFYRQVINHDHFVISNEVPTASLMATSAGQFKTQSAAAASSSKAAPIGTVSARDLAVLEQFGFMNQVRSEAQDLMNGTKSFREVAEGKVTKTEITELPACLYEAPQAILGGEVLSFAVTGGAGIGIGYNSGGDLTSNVGGTVNFTSSKLEIGLRTDDPLSRQTFAIGDGVARQSDVKFGFDFLTSLVGLDFFYKTPITDVIRSAMTDGLDQIAAKYITTANVKTWNDAWETRVIYDPEIANNDTHIAMRGGDRAGIQVGDTFAVTNLHYAWEGAPCTSKLRYRIGLTATPIATAKVVTVGDNVAVAEVTYLIEQQIQPGARIKLLKLNEPVATTAALTK